MRSWFSFMLYCRPKRPYFHNSFRGVCIKFPALWYSSPPSFFKIFIFFPKNSVPFPSSQLDNLPYSLNIIHRTDDITTPYPFFHVIFSPKALKLPSPLHNLKFFPKTFDKLPPPQGWGMRNFIHPWNSFLLLKITWFSLQKPAKLEWIPLYFF